jgi:hypothetical protein
MPMCKECDAREEEVEKIKGSVDKGIHTRQNREMTTQANLLTKQSISRSCYRTM